MDSLIYNSKIEVKKSPIHGYGIFAKENIKKDEILEECHFIPLNYDGGYMSYYQPSNIERYIFTFPKTIKKSFNSPKEKLELVLPLGGGCIYNSSPNANADWQTDVKRRLFIYKAIKNIKKGEEICTNYESHITWCKKNNLI
tara:strand:- start:38 stop:463 length:426 start_codon:yes stop_codon:yes gene_type:complete